MKLLRRLASPRDSNSLAVRLRRKRFAFFEELLASVPRPFTILDIGGNQRFWELMGFADQPDVSIQILNTKEMETTLPNVSSRVGDARDLREIPDASIDVVFSNSVIEHVGGYDDQRRMADEVQRVSRRYFVQTPNRYFPIEPHFLFPLFQFLPKWLKVFLIMNFKIGWAGPVRDRAKAERRAEAIRLLSRRELAAMFPKAPFYAERVFGLVKSYIVYDGWERTP